MTRECPHAPATRRGFLALAGAIVLAGCSALPFTGEGEAAVGLDSDALHDIGRRETPTHPETVPVAIEDAHLRASADRTRERLSVAPNPFGPDEIPNGAIREGLASMRQSATDALGQAESASSALERMTALQRAREEAGGLAAGWRFIEGDLAREDLIEDAAGLREDVGALRSTVEYVGADPVRATPVYAVVERGLESARHHAAVDRERVESTRPNPVSVGELGGDVEHARVLVDDTGYLYDRYASSVDGDTSVRPTLDAAVASLLSTIESDRGSLPAFDPDEPGDSLGREVEETPGVWALRRLHDEATESGAVQYDREEGRPASAVLAAQRELTYVGAFEALHDRVSGGETFAIGSADDVAAIRAEAVRAVEAAADAVDHPHLASRQLSYLSSWFDRGDHELANVEDGVEADWIVRDVAGYVVAAALARALPAASSRVASALEATG